MSGFLKSKKIRYSLLAVLVVIAAALFAAWRFGLYDRSQMTFLDEDGFPLNVNPEIVSAQDAPLEDADLVMGVYLGDEARAYPVNYMNGPHNEVVNDTLGGRPIASSW